MKQSKNGFTIVEMLAVVGVIAVLISIIVTIIHPDKSNFKYIKILVNFFIITRYFHKNSVLKVLRTIFYPGSIYLWTSIFISMQEVISSSFFINSLSDIVLTTRTLVPIYNTFYHTLNITKKGAIFGHTLDFFQEFHSFRMPQKVDPCQ